MTQITTGIRAVLSSPVVYEAFQDMMGARRGRTMLVADYIKPFEEMHILDIGCGTGEILNFLPKNIVYHGYDVSEDYIAHARARFGDRGVFSCMVLDTAELQKLPKFDLVMGLGVLHHLNDSEAVEFMALAAEALKPGGRLLTRDPCFEKGQNILARFLIAQDRGQNVRTAAQYRALATVSFSQAEGQVTHQSWIPYTHWTMVCRQDRK